MISNKDKANFEKKTFELFYCYLKQNFTKFYKIVKNSKICEIMTLGDNKFHLNYQGSKPARLSLYITLDVERNHSYSYFPL